MADSEDEYDRKRRDKFRGERSSGDSYRSERRGDDRRRDDWPERNPFRGGAGRGRPDYRDYRGPRDRYSPGREMPPAKRMRPDWGEDMRPNPRYGGYDPYLLHAWNHEHYPPAHGGGMHGYGGGHPQPNTHPRELSNNSDVQTQPAMLTLKQFLDTQDDGISDSEVLTKYSEYKLDFKRQQLNEFFVTHKDEEWFKNKYHPEESVTRQEEQFSFLKKRVDVFQELLENGTIPSVSIDTSQSDQLLRLLDTVVIKLEGGNEDDLKILDEKPKEIIPITYPERIFEKKPIPQDDDVIITFVEKKPAPTVATVETVPIVVSPRPLRRAPVDDGEENWDDDDDDDDDDAVVVNNTISKKSPTPDEDIEKNHKDNDFDDPEENKNKKQLKRKRSSSESSDSSSDSDKSDSDNDANTKDGDDEDEDDDDDDDDEDNEKVNKKYDLTSKDDDEDKEDNVDASALEASSQAVASKKDEDISISNISNDDDNDGKSTPEVKKVKEEFINSDDESKEIKQEEVDEEGATEVAAAIKVDADKKADDDDDNDANGKVNADEKAPTTVEDENQPETIDLDKEKDVPQPRALHRTSSIFLRNLAPTITKADIEAACQRFEGYLRVAIADPLVERRWFRRGWVTFKRDVNIKEICWNLNNTRLKDCEMGAIVNRDLSRRVRPVNGLTAHKTIVRSDIKLCAKVAINLDEKFKLWVNESMAGNAKSNGKADSSSYGFKSNNPVLQNITDFLIEEASAEEDELLGLTTGGDNKELSDGEVIERDAQLISVLDNLILYLRIVHSVDFYNHCEYPYEDEMPNRCGIIHARGPAPQNRCTQNEIQDYIKNFENKMQTFLAKAAASVTEEELKNLGCKDAEAEVEKFVQANTQELAKDKWLCPLSGKKFRGPEFIRKHIFNKHGEKVDEVRKEVEYFNNYLKDPKRPHLPEHPGSNRRTNSESNQGPGGFRPQHGGYPAPYTPQYPTYSAPMMMQPRGRGGGFGGGRRDTPMDHQRRLIGYHDLDAPTNFDMFD